MIGNSIWSGRPKQELRSGKAEGWRKANSLQLNMTDVPWNLRWVAETGSTNADLRQLAEQQPASQWLAASQPKLAASLCSQPVVLVADHQTQGRGRHGRSWVSPPGKNLLFSVLLYPRCELADYGWLTQLAALSVREACRQLTGVPVQLKWPNDVLANGCKLAGILAELVAGGTAVVLGIGLNVNWPGPDHVSSDSATPASGPQFSLPPTSLRQLCAASQPTSTLPELDRRAVLEVVLEQLASGLAQLAQPGWQAQLRLQVIDASATLGQRVRVELPQQSVVGQAIDLSAAGALVLKPDDPSLGSELEILAGDVTHAGIL